MVNLKRLNAVVVIGFFCLFGLKSFIVSASSTSEIEEDLPRTVVREAYYENEIDFIDHAKKICAGQYSQLQPVIEKLKENRIVGVNQKQFELMADYYPLNISDSDLPKGGGMILVKNVSKKVLFFWKQIVYRGDFLQIL